MCELLAMSANVPTDIRFSFSALVQRGGATGVHTDGWGITFYEQKGCRSLHDPNPSAHSELAKFLKAYPIKSCLVIAHVRKANRGKVALENTHPFIREMWGQYWSFAHNGQLKGIKKRPLVHYQPVGSTDSEHAFCWLLDQIRIACAKRPSNARLKRIVADAYASLRDLGVFNALLGDGHALYASCSTKLCYIRRAAPFGRASLIDEDMEVDFAKETTPDDKVIIVASTPLTRDESWTVVPPGSTIVFRDGERVD
ncbi:class II glutamine amidotransferase [Asticcacaulis sp. AC402]|uniref:class II glutamine amidotransferase n=1 Tax=Asticcacaulis sp. AC402 TaxID=1282361 RepID=UPI0003C3F286|nr:class II glutamine amidotransferase [Asticcacaulis sp. AC402]ESQ74247.1 glutamine amidotransferase [Asticcacaulis sp. AC402]